MNGNVYILGIFVVANSVIFAAELEGERIAKVGQICARAKIVPALGCFVAAAGGWSGNSVLGLPGGIELALLIIGDSMFALARISSGRAH